MNVRPSLDEILAYDGPATHAAVSVQLLADAETPVSVYAKLTAGARDAVLLESVEGGERMARYSFIVRGDHGRLSVRDGLLMSADASGVTESPVTDPLVPLEAALTDRAVWSPVPLPRFHGGAVGYLGFDCIRYFEDVPLAEEDALGLPEAVFVFAREVYIYDHVTRRLSLVIQAPLHGDRAAHHAAAVGRLTTAVDALAEPAPQLRPLPAGAELGALPNFVSNRSQQQMEAAVSQAREAIAAGEVFQVVLSQRFTVHDQVDPLTLYRALRALNPSPYMFLFQLRDFALVGASPEVLVRVEDDDIFLRPIAGTRRRGHDAAEDLALEEDLLADEKELAEHRMLVDLGRNDVGRVAEIGTVRLDDPLHIERYAHVMHIVSDVHGRLAPGKSSFDVLRACFPAGTVSGAPKVRACELIAQLEPDRRGVYAGAVGYFGDNGNMDLCIAIRSLVAQRDRVSTQAGAGIVWDSDPTKEHEECLHKARSGLRAIGLAQAWGRR